MSSESRSKNSTTKPALTLPWLVWKTKLLSRETSPKQLICLPRAAGTPSFSSLNCHRTAEAGVGHVAQLADARLVAVKQVDSPLSALLLEQAQLLFLDGQ